MCDLHRPPRLGSSMRGTSDPPGKRVLHVATPLVAHACSRMRKSLRAVIGFNYRRLLVWRVPHPTWLTCVAGFERAFSLQKKKSPRSWVGTRPEGQTFSKFPVRVAVFNGKLCATNSGTFHKQKSSQLLRTSDQDMIDESCI